MTEATHTPPTEQRQLRPSKARLTFFDYETAPFLKETDIVTEVTGDNGAAERYREIQTAGGSEAAITRVLLRHAEADGFSLITTYLKPGKTVPRHSHSMGCVYYVTYGSVSFGNRTIGVGDGAFVPGEAPYSVTSGVDGAELLEFRLGTSFDMRVREHDEAYWAQLLEHTCAERAAWVRDATPPTRR